MNAEREPSISDRHVMVLLLVMFAVVLLRNAWIGDDAYITLRTVDNFVHGYGLRWNVAERVQAYTHPLWMFVLTAGYALTREPYFTTLVLSCAFSMGAVYLLLFKVGATLRTAIAAALALVVSKAFMDYSTSGLENPLSHLLLAWFVIACFRAPATPATGDAPPLASAGGDRRAVRRLAFIFSLVGLSRLDLLPLLFPALCVKAWPYLRRGPDGFGRRVQTMILGFTPLIAWELFSVFYYGSPFPNTAYAKLNIAVERGDLVRQGFCYLLESLRGDPVTLLVVLWMLASAWRGRNREERPIAAGMLLYLFYLVYIGGDFMTGRFLTPLFFLAVLMIVRRPLDWPGAAASGAAVLVLGLVSPQNPLASGEDYADRPYKSFHVHNGIADERGFFYPDTGLLRYRRQIGNPPYNDHVRTGREAAEQARKDGGLVTVHYDGTIGFYSYEAGPLVHIVDIFCLAVPLLARLPSFGSYTGEWRVGHFTRSIPVGYVDTLRTGTNTIANPRIARFYDKLSFVVRGPLWSPRRLLEIIKLNAGLYDNLLGTHLVLRPDSSRLLHRAGKLEPQEGSHGELVVAAKAGVDRAEFLAYGCYGTLKQGRYMARYRLKLTPSIPPESLGVATVEVTASHSRIMLAQRALLGTDFPADGSWKEFDLPFEVPPKRLRDMEFRVWYHGRGDLSLDEISVAAQ